MTKDKLNKLELACMFVGTLPVPIVGEIAGTIGVYSLVKDTPLVNKNKFSALALSAATTGLMRLGLYQDFPKYKQAYDFFLNLF